MSQRGDFGTPRPGRPAPLGASWDGEGTNFAVYSRHASGVTVCLYEPDGDEPIHTVEVQERTNGVWHVYVPGVHVGMRYGFRVDGAYEPKQGHRFNPSKLMLDPYAKAIDGKVQWDPSVFPYVFESTDDSEPDDHPNDQFVPKGVVAHWDFDWEGDRRPNIPLNESVIYELHVKGFTQLNRLVPEPLRGTYAALAQPEVIDHLQGLGVTAVELLPVHQFVHDHFLRERGLRNYWGYNSIGFFTPEPRYLAEGSADEMRIAVRRLHAIRRGAKECLDNQPMNIGRLSPSIAVEADSSVSIVATGVLLKDGPRPTASAAFPNGMRPRQTSNSTAIRDGINPLITPYRKPELHDGSRARLG